ncbi:MAG: hypothetical protein KDB00_18130 [Planctomycetales bacterium]|nr:hypothetical protein [Planctomycetales bacterium]
MTNTATTSIRCLPRSICSWSYELSWGEHRGLLELNVMGEQGSINIDGTDFQVCKHGMLSGNWTLRHNGEEVAEAQKSSAFTRTFEIDSPGGPLRLEAESVFNRSFFLRSGDQIIATMRPDHPFTRRARIEIVAQDWDFPTICFSFWLVAQMWRRAANNNGG